MFIQIKNTKCYRPYLINKCCKNLQVSKLRRLTKDLKHILYRPVETDVWRDLPHISCTYQCKFD